MMHYIHHKILMVHEMKKHMNPHESKKHMMSALIPIHYCCRTRAEKRPWHRICAVPSTALLSWQAYAVSALQPPCLAVVLSGADLQGSTHLMLSIGRILISSLTFCLVSCFSNVKLNSLNSTAYCISTVLPRWDNCLGTTPWWLGGYSHFCCTCVLVVQYMNHFLGGLCPPSTSLSLSVACCTW